MVCFIQIGISIMVKKKKLKLSKKQRKQLKSVAVPIAIGIAGLLVGIVATKILASTHTPANIVWAADKTVKVPEDLRRYLDTKNDCKAYRGTDTPTGVGLWGVYQVSKSQYAKIAYGCSWNLTNYIMAVKHEGKWQLIEPTEYFAPFKDGVDPTKGALPYCAVVEKYKIPNAIEPFCIKPDGNAQSNQL